MNKDKLPKVANMAVLQLPYATVVLPLKAANAIVEALSEAEVIECNTYSLQSRGDAEILFKNTAIPVDLTVVSKKTYDKNKMNYVLGLQDQSEDKNTDE